MPANYDFWGWYTTDPQWAARVVDHAPASVPASAEVGQPYPNWTGVAWVDLIYVAPELPPAPPPPPGPVYNWFIDLGPFYDRFGAAKMAVLTSADPGVRAIIADLNIRKWVDLQRADVAQALAYVGSVVPAVTPAMQTTILTTPVAPEENLALRKVYFA